MSLLTRKLSDLAPDARNANKGTERGNAMIENSLRQFGAGRSILLDRHGRIIAGNKTAENAVKKSGTGHWAGDRKTVDALADPKHAPYSRQR